MQALPVPREETIYLEDPATFSVFESFNNRIPQGNEFANGYQQIGQEYLFLANFATGEVEPWLATTYEYNADYTVLTIKLRDDVTWNDGEPFSSADVVYTFEAVMKEDKLGGIGLRETIEAITAPDATTVRIELKESDPRFIYTLYGQVTGFTIWPKHIWENEDPLTFKNNPPVTTSVWKLKQVISNLRMFVWERNENYWTKDERFPEAKYVVIRTAPASPDADLQEFIANSIDSARNLQWFQLELAQQSNPAVTYGLFQDPCPRTVSFNTQHPPFSDPQLRWAMSYLIDREKIAEIIAQPPSVPATHPWSDWELLQQFIDPAVLEEYKLEYDPARAAQMLDELGYTLGDNGTRVDAEGRRLQFTMITPDAVGTFAYEIGQEIATEARGAGIDLTVRALAAAPYDEAIATGNFDLASTFQCGAFIDAIDLYNQFTFSLPGQVKPVPGERTPGAYSWNSLNSPEFDEVVAQLRGVGPDAPEADALYSRALELWMQGLPVVPVIQMTYHLPWNETYWAGWPTDENMFTVPFPWWTTFYKVPFELTRAGNE